MARGTSESTVSPSPQTTIQTSAERLAYVAATNDRRSNRPDELCVVDLAAESPTCGQIIHRLELPYVGDGVYRMGWNACSSTVRPAGSQPHLEGRYLILAGLNSSRIYIVDTKPSPEEPHIVKIIEPQEVLARSGYSRLHAVRCGPDAIYVSAMGAPHGHDGPGGIFLLNHDSFDIVGPWEIDRNGQELAYDFAFRSADAVLITGEWGNPAQFENGIVLEDLLAGTYGHHLHFWNLNRRRNMQTIDIGAQHQMLLGLCPAHDPAKRYGFAAVAISRVDLSASVWTWYRAGGRWQATKTITIPAQPAAASDLPSLLKGFKTVPPLATGIKLSPDDKFLYVSCWGTGELHQYDVTDPFRPHLTDKTPIGGIVHQRGHPQHFGRLRGGPHMVESSRDGRRIYVTNSFYSTWDDQFYPDRMSGWMVRMDISPDGGMTLDPNFFVDFGETRPHQVQLAGGNA